MKYFFEVYKSVPQSQSLVQIKSDNQSTETQSWGIVRLCGNIALLKVQFRPLKQAPGCIRSGETYA